MPVCLSIRLKGVRLCVLQDSQPTPVRPYRDTAFHTTTTCSKRCVDTPTAIPYAGFRVR